MSKMKNVKRLPGPVVWLITLAIKLLILTLRTRVDDPYGVFAKDADPVIYSLWHNRMICLPGSVPRYVASRTSFLASQSRDGGYISDILGQFGMGAVRGSSSKGGARSLVEMRERLENGTSIAVTPDGPRGPRYEPKDGILWLASNTGTAIVPLTLNSKWHLEFKGWDRTQLPLPFSKSQLVVGEPLRIDPDLSNTDLDAARERVTTAMMAITEWDHPDS
jgi:lysophospholipid acyltransferase (LPLAT)-like uncharacterized protein